MSNISNAFADCTGIGETTGSKNEKIAREKERGALGSAEYYGKEAIDIQRELYDMLKPLYQGRVNEGIKSQDDMRMMLMNSQQSRDPVSTGSFSLPARSDAPPVVSGSYIPGESQVPGFPSPQGEVPTLPSFITDMLGGAGGGSTPQNPPGSVTPPPPVQQAPQQPVVPMPESNDRFDVQPMNGGPDFSAEGAFGANEDPMAMLMDMINQTSGAPTPPPTNQSMFTGGDTDWNTQFEAMKKDVVGRGGDLNEMKEITQQKVNEGVWPTAALFSIGG